MSQGYKRSRGADNQRNRAKRRDDAMRRMEPTNWASRHNTAMANPEGGWIYIIGGENTGEVKVGKTTRDVKVRLRDLQTGSSVQLQIMAKYRVTSHLANYEMLVHAALKPWRKKGEWFSCPPEVARSAWKQVVDARPQRAGSPQAWEAAHIQLNGWGANYVVKHPKTAGPLPVGVHIPPLGPPITVKLRPKPKMKMVKKNGKYHWVEVKPGGRKR